MPILLQREDLLLMKPDNSSESKETPGKNVFRKTTRDPEGSAGDRPSKRKAPTKKSRAAHLMKRVGYSVWLIVMIVGGGLAFVTFLFLI